MTTFPVAARLRPDQLDAAQRALYDAITSGPRSGSDAPFALVDDEGSLRGPFAAMLLAPAAGDAVQRLGAALRFESPLDDRLREIVILTVACVTRSVFERTAHEEVARRLGVSEAELESIRSGDAAVLAPRERRAIALTISLLGVEAPRAADYADDFDAAELYALSVLVGYYRMLAGQLHFFELDEPAR